MTELPTLLTAKQVAEETGLSRWTPYRLVKAERISHVRIGSAIRFSEPAVGEGIESAGSEG